MNLERVNYQIITNATCSYETIQTPLRPDHFIFFDKDGFELCEAEQLFYEDNSIPLSRCLNHYCSQQDWLKEQQLTSNVFVDHSIILHRCDFTDQARQQLESLREIVPQAQWLLQAKQKWGFDIAIDAATDDGTMYEVLHIEFDDYDSDQFQEKLCMVEEQLLSIDWSMAAQLINQQKDKWEHLHGFAQNHWKANYLIGWEQAEYTEKAF